MPRESLPQLLLSLLKELPKLVSDRFELLSLDVQRAGSALGQIIGLVVVVAILGVTAWLLIWGAILTGLVMLGLPPEAALLLAIVINLLGIWFAVSRMRRLVPKLLLGSIRKHLSLTPLPTELRDAPQPAAADAARRADGSGGSASASSASASASAA